uniref:Uncharacterized protein n=1 Tax=Solanum lycopersicum TaxID=4081 RepID=K4AW73_SOLLC
VEMKLLAQQRDLQAKIPDIDKCLDIVATLQAKKGSGEAPLKSNHGRMFSTVFLKVKSAIKRQG